MRRRNVIFAVAGLFFAGNLFAADQVKMATTEDLSAFDAQLGASAPAAPRARGAGGNGLGQVVSEEAKRLKEGGGSQAFGQQVRERATQNGLGQGMGRGSEASGSKGVGSETKAPGKKSKK